LPEPHELHNREFWDADADEYQAVHGDGLARGQVWGAWGVPEAELMVLGDVTGLDVLEYGCGAAQWSMALESAGARVVALDQSRGQLRHARRNVVGAGSSVQLICASGEAVPARDDSFDLVFCDHGAMSFCAPERSVPEIARVLRRGGRLVFSIETLLHSLCYDATDDGYGDRLRAPYFGARVLVSADGTADFHTTHGGWIRLFRANGMVVEDLVEIQPSQGASTTYEDFVQIEWARRWPAEEIWVVRQT
jgi:SAM-dependent methyltransferase